MSSKRIVVETIGLSKSYPIGHVIRRRRPALVDLSLRIHEGDVFGYLGPNGSGKTTTLKLIMGLIRPDRGTVRVLDSPVHESGWRLRAGYLPENPYFYDFLTASEYLDYVGWLSGMRRARRLERARELLDLLGLNGFKGLSLRKFSKGMTQRLGLAQALMNDPSIVFLDEPMSGLDPIGRRFVRKLILDLKRQGKTVFFSTHILSDAEAVCDRVALLRDGRLVEVGALSEILAIGFSHLEVHVSGGRLEGVERPRGISACQALGERWRLEVEEQALVHVLAWIRERSGRILSVQPIRQSLEEHFMSRLGMNDEASAWSA